MTKGLELLGRVHGKLVHSRCVERLADAIAPLPEPDWSVLDVGCGDGRLGFHAWDAYLRRTSFSASRGYAEEDTVVLTCSRGGGFAFLAALATEKHVTPQVPTLVSFSGNLCCYSPGI